MTLYDAAHTLLPLWCHLQGTLMPLHTRTCPALLPHHLSTEPVFYVYTFNMEGAYDGNGTGASDERRPARTLRCPSCSSREPFGGISAMGRTLQRAGLSSSAGAAGTLTRCLSRSLGARLMYAVRRCRTDGLVTSTKPWTAWAALLIPGAEGAEPYQYGPTHMLAFSTRKHAGTTGCSWVERVANLLRAFTQTGEEHGRRGMA